MPYFFYVISVVGITLNIEKQMGIYDKANKHETRHTSVRVFGRVIFAFVRSWPDSTVSF